MKIVGQVWTLQVFEYTSQETDWILLCTAPIHNTSIVAKTQDLQKCNTKKKCCLNTCILPLKRAKYHNKLTKLISSNRILMSCISWSFDSVLSKSSLKAKSNGLPSTNHYSNYFPTPMSPTESGETNPTKKTELMTILLPGFQLINPAKEHLHKVSHVSYFMLTLS